MNIILRPSLLCVLFSFAFLSSSQAANFRKHITQGQVDKIRNLEKDSRLFILEPICLKANIVEESNFEDEEIYDLFEELRYSVVARKRALEKASLLWIDDKWIKDKALKNASLEKKVTAAYPYLIKLEELNKVSSIFSVWTPDASRIKLNLRDKILKLIEQLQEMNDKLDAFIEGLDSILDLD